MLGQESHSLNIPIHPQPGYGTPDIPTPGYGENNMEPPTNCLNNFMGLARSHPRCTAVSGIATATLCGGATLGVLGVATGTFLTPTPLLQGLTVPLFLISISSTIASLVFTFGALTDEPEPNEEQLTWDNYVQDNVDASASRLRDIYTDEDGLQEKFTSQKPTEAQIGAINSFINENLAKLKEDGVSTGGISIRFPDGQDPYMTVDFNSSENKEWCLLCQGDNIYHFITTETVGNFVTHGSSHPITRKPLTDSDFIRGKALLDILKE